MEEINFYEKSVQGAVERIIALLQRNDNCCKDVHKVYENSFDMYHLNIVRMLLNFLDCKDKYTKGHCERVTKYTVALGQALELEDIDILNLEFASLLHDIGKLAVPDKILNKKGRLTVQEYEMVKKHPIEGYELIKDISFLEASKKILLQHHERVDGRGYPLGLMDQQIDICSKILSVADAYDAMISSRPYRKQETSKEEAIMQLKLCSGSQFDKNVVDVFVKVLMFTDVA